MPIRKIARYGWKPDLPDHRDHKFAPKPVHLPALTDLRVLCPPVYDQGELGSCTANAIGALFEFVQKKEKFEDFTPSRLFIYYNERVLEGTVDQDAGAELRDGMKSLAKQGVCHESLWPYDIDKFADHPPNTALQDAHKHLILSYSRLSQTLTSMRLCLAGGYPFVFGFSVYESFESDEVALTGDVALPSMDEALVGGHAVLCVGYNDGVHKFLCRNSWGTDWGKSGYFTMPYNYLINPSLASDFWTLKTTEK